MDEVRGVPPGPFPDLKVIRVEAGMSTARFCALIDMLERTWRSWQARARDGRPARGPWLAPVRETVEPYVVKHAETHTAWGHRTVWAPKTDLTPQDGHRASPSTTLRILRRRGLLQPPGYTRERRQLTAARRAAFTVPPSAPNRVRAAGLFRVRNHPRGNLADRRSTGDLREAAPTGPAPADRRGCRRDVPGSVRARPERRTAHPRRGQAGRRIGPGSPTMTATEYPTSTGDLPHLRRELPT